MKLLINEDPIPLLPSLAMKVGLNAALFLQQLHYRLNISKNIRDGHKWVFNTYDDWMEEFPFWSLNTIKRITYDLEQKGYLISTSKHNRMKIDNTKWYRIDYEQLPFSYKPNEIPANPTWDATPPQHESTANPQLDAVPTHTETVAYPTMGRPITKELKNIKNKPIVEKNLDVAHSVIQYLNDKTGKQFKPQSAATHKFINGRIKEGYTQEDFIRVIDLKTKQWLNRPEFSAFLRPSTLFNATNFENYVNELVTPKKPKRHLPVAPVLDFNKGDE
ncbi:MULTISPECIES: conserved phage C-terminal domain-containing protein [unclassified Sporosarcina]|uniref:conserved phage C-terminal domain-containing protein n=1 Tax=unclassified Sporosarcina TaxID=2647733 RepID=UPI000C1702B2|nr:MULTISPECIES: conserved phage C-terminal domain-containing protein [unclassified Sporosarcina]PIC67998.1 replication protein [Sporosarcina sp. P16a]PIC83095.1 replication protein [Sporosarcina sp. P1]PIC90915.1 replication protein [Sporosarcina sp. P21c]PIC94307.1 replication protein [Sporosarcina sp. P25]PID23638.1 replication protein [Sporosarcina sp. P7]